MYRWSVTRFCEHALFVSTCMCRHNGAFTCVSRCACVHGYAHACIIHALLACMACTHVHVFGSCMCVCILACQCVPMCVHLCVHTWVCIPVPAVHIASCSRLEESTYFSLTSALSPLAACLSAFLLFAFSSSSPSHSNPHRGPHKTL